MYFIFFMGKVYHTDFRKNEELVSNVNAVDNYSFFIYSISTNTFLKIQNMKKIENAVLLYVCSRGAYELFPFIEKLYPYLALATAKASNSVDALKAIPESGLITVLTSNAFYHADANVVGADKNPENKMRGSTLARLIKEKNENAKVYLHAETLDKSPIFNGYFKRNMEDGTPSRELHALLEGLDDLAKANVKYQVQKKILTEFKGDFQLKNAIKLRLSAQEMKEFFKTEELQDLISSNWPLNFYCRQLFRLSFRKLMEDTPQSRMIELSDELERITESAKHNATKAIVTLVLLDSFKKELSPITLSKIFNRVNIKDDLCAQIAYDEYMSRTENV